MKTNFLIYIILLVAYLFFVRSAEAEDIHFNNEVYKLKVSCHSEESGRYENEYFPGNDTKTNWTKMIGIYYYPEITSPRKYAVEAEKTAEKKENIALLKFIENKKQNKALLSYLENGNSNGKNYFEYNIFKYEEHPDKGIMVLRYAKKYFFSENEEITKIGYEVKSINDDLLEQLIITYIPPIVERDIP